MSTEPSRTQATPDGRQNRAAARASCKRLWRYWNPSLPSTVSAFLRRGSKRRRRFHLLCQGEHPGLIRHPIKGYDTKNIPCTGCGIKRCARCGGRRSAVRRGTRRFRLFVPDLRNRRRRRNLYKRKAAHRQARRRRTSRPYRYSYGRKAVRMPAERAVMNRMPL